MSTCSGSGCRRVLASSLERADFSTNDDITINVKHGLTSTGWSCGAVTATTEFVNHSRGNRNFLNTVVVSVELYTDFNIAEVSVRMTTTGIVSTTVLAHSDFGPCS